MFHNNQTSAVTAWEYICHWAHTSDLYSPSPRSLFALCTAKKNIFCALKNHSLQIKIRPINTHHKHKCSYFLFAWSPSNSCAFTYTSLCVFKSVKVLRWQGLSRLVCLCLSVTYTQPLLNDWTSKSSRSFLPITFSLLDILLWHIIFHVLQGHIKTGLYVVGKGLNYTLW